MQQIIPHLWIGTIQNGNDSVLLNSKKINIIVNCSRDMETHGINNVLRIPVSAAAGEYSTQCEVMYKHIPSIVDNIHRNIMKNKNILVCCPTGQQQSPTVVVSYLMKYGNVDMKLATKYVTSKMRSAFMPEMIFRNSLIMYQKYLFS